jgi:hypothetical protein
VSAKQAATHPIPGAHSIWELISHLTAWVEIALGALDGVPIPPWPGMPVELDWPPVIDTSNPAWKHAVDSFFAKHFRLVERIKAFTDERLESVVPGRSYDFYRLFQSTVQHAVYHAGQIALLKKASAKLTALAP